MTQTAPAGWYPDPENPAQQRYWDGAGWSPKVEPTSPPGSAPQHPASPGNMPQPVVDAPVLQTWKTSVWFSVLGALLGLPLLMTLSSVLAILPMILFAMLTGLDDPQSYSPILALIGNTLMLVYAVAVYPSYFSVKPRLRSSRLISFANLTFGGLIYGLLWNANLTRRTKGISYIVSAVGSGLMCLWLAFSILTAVLLGAVSGPAGAPGDPSTGQIAPVSQKDVQPLERAQDADVYADADTGASFVISSAWTELPLSKEREFIDTKFVVSDAAYATYGSVDMWSTLTEEDKKGKTRDDFDSMDDFQGDFSEIVGYSGPDGTAQTIMLNGVEYFAMSLPLSAKGVEWRTVVLMRLENGYVYQFQYFSTPAELADGIDDEDLRTFYSMVASMDYP